MGIIEKALALNDLSLTNLGARALTQDEIVALSMKWVGGIAGIIAFLFLVYGGFMYLTAAGNAEQSKKGGQAIINAIIGLIIIALAYGITTYIVKLLNNTGP